MPIECHVMQTDFEAAARDAKRRRVHEAEMAWVEVGPPPLSYGHMNLQAPAIRNHDMHLWLGMQGGAAAAEKQTAEDGQGSGRFRAIIDTVIGNLQLSITNVHIRFEVGLSDSKSHAANLVIHSTWHNALQRCILL